MNQPLRLTPVSASRKVICLEFIRRYFNEHGSSPSLGEIAAALNTQRTQARRIVLALSDDGHLSYTGQPRSIMLPDPVDEIAESDILRRLRADGWIVNEDARSISAPVTNSYLLNSPQINDIPAHGGPGRADDDTGSKCAA